METVHDPGEHGDTPSLTRIFLSHDETAEPHRSLVAAITWQDGPIKKYGINGVQTEDILNLLIERMEAFQDGRFACKENARVLDHLHGANGWLKTRTALRVSQGVEGEDKPHLSPVLPPVPPDGPPA